MIPGYNMYYSESVFGGRNGVYGNGGLQNPPIPYHGKVYMHRGNSLIAFAPQAGQPVQLPMAEIIPYQDPSIHIPSVEDLKSTLAQEIQKIISSGHLRTGYFSTGLLDLQSIFCGDDLLEYWHNPGDTIITLLQSLPFLPTDLQQQTRNYIQTEFSNFPPYLYNHIGWKDGAPRETFILPPEVETDRINDGT